MIHRPSSTIHRASENKMAANARKVLTPTICSVQKGSLAVTPVIMRDILTEIKKSRLCRPFVANEVYCRTGTGDFCHDEVKCFEVDRNGNLQTVYLLPKEVADKEEKKQRCKGLIL